MTQRCEKENKLLGQCSQSQTSPSTPQTASGT